MPFMNRTGQFRIPNNKPSALAQFRFRILDSLSGGLGYLFTSNNGARCEVRMELIDSLPGINPGTAILPLCGFDSRPPRQYNQFRRRCKYDNPFGPQGPESVAQKCGRHIVPNAVWYLKLFDLPSVAAAGF